MFTPESRNVSFETLKYAKLAEFPRLCRANRQMSEICNSPLGRQAFQRALQVKINEIINLLNRNNLGGIIRPENRLRFDIFNPQLDQLHARYRQLEDEFAIQLLERHPEHHAYIFTDLSALPGMTLQGSLGPETQYSPGTNQIVNIISNYTPTRGRGKGAEIAGEIFDYLSQLGLQTEVDNVEHQIVQRFLSENYQQIPIIEAEIKAELAR